MIARIVASHVHVGSTPAFFNKCTNAFSASSWVAKPLMGMTGSSGRLGRAGSADAVVIGSLAAAAANAGLGGRIPGAGVGTKLPATKLGAAGRGIGGLKGHIRDLISLIVKSVRTRERLASLLVPFRPSLRFRPALEASPIWILSSPSITE